MSFYSPELPLQRAKQNGYKMLDDLRNVVKQNFKMLILTSPGERIMIPSFGVGIYNLLFEPYGPELNGKITSTIRKQVKKYLPYIEIKKMQIEEVPQATGETTDNSLSVVITYYVKSLNFSDVLKIDVNQQFQ